MKVEEVYIIGMVLWIFLVVYFFRQLSISYRSEDRRQSGNYLLFAVALSVATLLLFGSMEAAFLALGIQPNGYIRKVVASFLRFAFVFHVAVAPIFLIRGYYRRKRFRPYSNPALN